MGKTLGLTRNEWRGVLKMAIGILALIGLVVLLIVVLYGASAVF